MKSKTDLAVCELYALERAARLAQAREIARLIRAGGSALIRGSNALVRALIRFARRAASVPNHRKEISHA